MENYEYKVLGMMSGTSLDGLDLAFCRFEDTPKGWKFEIVKAETMPYESAWKKRLAEAVHLTGEALSQLHIDYGALLGLQASHFLKKHQLEPDFIASHGHTVFHQPERRLTLQIGSGWEIAIQTGHKVIADFRSKDLALGGQGAPLVPIGDRLLFANHDFCLNLGGIANVSMEWQGKRIAYDVCPANMLLNFLAQDLGLDFDRGGRKASEGQTDETLLRQLNSLAYYQLAYPKSLGWEWFAAEVIPLLRESKLSIPNQLRTGIEHIAQQISHTLTQHSQSSANQRVLVTGGGAKNTFLMDRIQAQLPENIEIIIPPEMIIDFKEALVFAFLGVLRAREEVNCLASVTGARRDNCGGLVFML